MVRSSSSSSSSSSSDSSQDSVKFTSLVVSNLTRTVTDEHLKEIFSCFGEIHSVGIRRSPTVKHYALINYKSKEDADVAKAHMHNADIDGIKIVVKFEDPEKEAAKKSPDKRGKPVEKRERDRSREKNTRQERSRRDNRDKGKDKPRDKKWQKESSKKKTKGRKRRDDSSDSSSSSSSSSSGSSS